MRELKKTKKLKTKKLPSLGPPSPQFLLWATVWFGGEQGGLAQILPASDFFVDLACFLCACVQGYDLSLTGGLKLSFGNGPVWWFVCALWWWADGVILIRINQL